MQLYRKHDVLLPTRYNQKKFELPFKKKCDPNGLQTQPSADLTNCGPIVDPVT